MGKCWGTKSPCNCPGNSTSQSWGLHLHNRGSIAQFMGLHVLVQMQSPQQSMEWAGGHRGLVPPFLYAFTEASKNVDCHSTFRSCIRILWGKKKKSLTHRPSGPANGKWPHCGTKVSPEGGAEPNLPWPIFWAWVKVYMCMWTIDAHVCTGISSKQPSPQPHTTPASNLLASAPTPDHVAIIRKQY